MAITPGTFSRPLRRFVPALTLLWLGCGGVEPALLVLDVGREQAALDADSGLRNWQVEFVGQSERTTLAEGSWPSRSLALPAVDPSWLGRFALRLHGEAGAEWYGESPTITVDALSGRRLPLFVQARGQFARPSADLDGRTNPLLSAAAGRLLIVGGGEGAQANQLSAHDLALGQALTARTLERAPEGLAASDTVLYLSRGAELSALGLSDGAEQAVSLPDGLDGEQLRGAPLLGRDDQVVVWLGPARDGAVSDAVLWLGRNDVQRLTRLPTPMQNARHAWLPDQGLALWGDGAAHQLDAEGSLQPAEVPLLAAAARDWHGYATLSDGSHLGVHEAAAGDFRAEWLPASCERVDQCAVRETGALDCATRLQLLSLGNEALLLCDQRDGQSAAFALHADAPPTPLPLREARRGASLVRLAAEQAAVVGGGPLAFESYRPPRTP